MPKFTEQEKNLIQQRLFEEGEKLFISHGLKKVTLNDLTKAVSISHGAFYAFFDSKEQLFFEINLKKQEEIFLKLNQLITQNKNKKPKEITKLALLFISQQFFSEPIISSITCEVWEHLSRKLPSDLINKGNQIDAAAIGKLMDVGVEFQYPIPLVTKLLQATYTSVSNFINYEDGEIATDIFFDAVINQIVKD